ncbi:alpha-L-fucosidase [Mucilaginibacter glaciei]|uniref:alpha-L-fucosidase n=1 Tax=Mucilaginibacter glaciei TaxID=2772109 RepID=A0A926NQX0_9SPHI|nr:alpha-L-fucosidase [Mucilaginibacter glaciei]MBD1393392.1 alpha-L-fucosidase [Mucilaginibacter glaciei]
MEKILIILLAGLFYINNLQAQTPVAPPADPKMNWWKHDKFGMFIHWGLYSVPAGTYHDKKIKGIGEWIMNTAKIPVAEYQQYAKQFNPDKYDPEAWVRIAKDAGMKYIVITAKHHDGFAMFDSKVTDWDVVDSSPYGKDIIGPLIAACHKAGLKIGLYYSQAQDWHHPGGAASGGHWDKAQDGSFDDYIDKISVPQVKEILSNYGGIDVLWWDTPQDMTRPRAEKFEAVIKNYPALITNNRLGGGFDGDTETPEQFVPATGFPGRNWESCMTMNDTWGYKSYDENWKSPQTLIRNLADVVSKGGNMLLNVGPNARGEIPQPSIDRLAAVGKWLKVNKESIYGTTASPFPYLSWGRATRKGQKLYLHVFDNPADGRLVVPMKNKVSHAYLLADAAKRALKVSLINGRNVIIIPANAADSIDRVVVLQFVGHPQVAPSPGSGKKVIASSQKDSTNAPQNLTDGNRFTRWQAAKGDKKAWLEIDLQKPVPISTLILDEPWHPWENKKQEMELQYKQGEKWVSILKNTTGGSGYITGFKPVTARYFRLLIENKIEEPVLLEWQLYGPE